MKKALFFSLLLCVVVFTSSCSSEAEELRLRFVQEYVVLTEEIATCEEAGTLWDTLDLSQSGESNEFGILQEFSSQETKEQIAALDEMLNELFLCSDEKSALLFYDRAMTQLRILQNYSEFAHPMTFDQKGELYSVCSTISMFNGAFHQILGDPILTEQ